MELIKINQSELKVMMSADDMKKYDLSGDEDEYAQKAALRGILREARERIGFACSGEKLIVRMFPSRDGGCEMFVTKLSAKSSTERENGVIFAPASLYDGVYVYSFANLNDMISACRRLSDAGYRDGSSAYRDNAGRGYYLIIGIKSPLAEEMGGELMKLSTMYYINEYCSLLCDEAVPELARFG